MVTPSSPCGAAACMTSAGYSPVLSMSAARGATMSAANRSIDSLNARWSGVSSSNITLDVVFRKTLEDGFQPISCRREIFRQHPHVPHDGHEVRVAAPPRNDVNVQVIDDAGARGP